MNPVNIIARAIIKNKTSSIFWRNCASITKENHVAKILNDEAKIQNSDTIIQNDVAKIQNDVAKIQNDDVFDLEREIKELKIRDRDSILKPLTEDISFIGPYVRPTFNFAAYINKSETLQNLVKLGVDLHQIEKKRDAPEFIMKLNFEDLKPHIFFLNDIGVTADLIGDYLTKNPFIFKEDLETLQVRVNYLQSKKFSDVMISKIVTENPHWLMFSTQRIDTRLGHFQKTFSLSGNEIRNLATKSPKLITYKMHHIKLNTFSVKEEMGFTDPQMKELLLKIPKFWMMSQESILGRFDYVHKIMNISHEQILQMPKILLSRKFRIEQRHKFLEKIGRAQYDPKKERYVSLDRLVEGTDVQFCADVAKTSVQIYNTFLKTL